jgi:Yip1-like protein
MLRRMINAARLDTATYEEVENDPNATLQALLVVIIVALAAGVGALLAVQEEAVNPIWGFVSGVIGGLIRWALWALITFLVGTTILKTARTNASWSQLARTTGFAQTPGILQILVFIPIIGWIIAAIAGIWQLVAMVVAVRQALDYESIWRTLGVVVIGFIIIAIVLAVIGALLALLGGLELQGI